MDIHSLREQFPALGRRGIYLDNAATSLTPEKVISEVARYYREYSVNAGRGAYRKAAMLTLKIEEARERVARFIGAEPDEIVFTANTTDSLNKLAMAFKFNKADKLAISSLEHHSNILPWRLASEKLGLDLNVIDSIPEGLIELESVEDVIGKGCRLVAVTACSNVLGTVQPVKEISSIARNEGCLVALDAAQLVGHRPLDVQDLGCDFMAFSGHKICGPTGVGILYVSKESQKLLDPAFLGGGTVKDVSSSGFTLRDFPESYEPGTLNIAGILGLSAALDFLEDIGLSSIEKRSCEMLNRLVSGFPEEAEVYTPANQDNIGIVSFNLPGLSAHQSAAQYDRKAGIMVRSGYHCAAPLVKTLGDGKGTVRVSLAFYNTGEEIETFLDTTRQILTQR